MFKLILASESPRRKLLLTEAQISFTVIPSKISEIPNENMNVDERILDIARQKSLAILKDHPELKESSYLILSADTEVVLNDKTLGKPQSETHAFEILSNLSGKSHFVKTGIIFLDTNNLREVSHCETTKITFNKLTNEQIWSYIKTGDPMDKAGAYGIQSVGQTFVQNIEGLFSNVVGLPIEIVKRIISENEWKFDE